VQLAPLLLLAWHPAQTLFRTGDADAVAVAMCVGTKTVALGIPIIQAVYEHNPAAGLLSLPLIIYHAEQILMGSLLTAPLKRWIGRRAKARAEQAAAAVANGDGAANWERAGGEGCGADAESGDGGGAQLQPQRQL